MDGREDRIEIHSPLVSLPLQVSVGALRLLDAGVAELVLDPPKVRAALEHPRRVGVPHGMGLPIGQFGGPDLVTAASVLTGRSGPGRPSNLQDGVPRSCFHSASQAACTRTTKPPSQKYEIVGPGSSTETALAKYRRATEPATGAR